MATAPPTGISTNPASLASGQPPDFSFAQKLDSPMAKAVMPAASDTDPTTASAIPSPRCCGFLLFAWGGVGVGEVCDELSDELWLAACIDSSAESEIGDGAAIFASSVAGTGAEMGADALSGGASTSRFSRVWEIACVDASAAATPKIIARYVEPRSAVA
jgi:hypothetical protein